MKFSTLNKFLLTTAGALFLSACGITSTQAQSADFTGYYTQNFDSALGTSGTALPPGFTSMVIAGANSTYIATSPINAAGIASATADTQTLIVWNVGTKVTDSGSQSFNIGCWDSLSDRAMGTDPTGTGAQVIQLALTNNTGNPLYGVTFNYDCKCMTNGSAGTEESELPGYCFFYSTTGTSSAANWTEVGVAGDVVGATNSSGVPIANGLCLPNFTEDTTMSSGPVNITFATPLTNNGVMYFRWADDNNEANSPDQMLAIDDISITNYIPPGPHVSITAPVNNSTVAPGSSIAISATALESGGTITNVAFYQGSTLLTNIASGPYNYTWPSVSVGNYALTAVASDANGITATSTVVNVSVAFTPPTVSITSPANGAAFASGASITLQSSTTDTSGTVTNVSYYSGSTLLGHAAASPYTLNWANVSAGSYSLTAQVEDNNGLMATSSVVSVTVTNSFVASFTGNYNENFDLDLSNSTTLLPPGFEALYMGGSHFTYTNLPGSFITTNAMWTNILVGSQTLVVWNAGSAVADASTACFNVGRWDSPNDRALGTDPTGTAGNVIQLALANNSGTSLQGVTFNYTEVCMTNGSTSNGAYTDDGTERLELPGYSFFYSIVGDTNPANWYEIPALCLTNWVQGTSSTSGPVTLLFPQPLTNNGVMYFRWADDNCVASSPDQMYAIDNISVASYNPNGPQVSFISPTNNENFIPGAGFTVSLNPTDSTATITNVTLYLDGSPVYTFNSTPYILPVPGGEIPAGSYVADAVATDTSGLSVTSSVVNFTVAYMPPTVALTNPASGSSYPAPATVLLSATAASSDGSITNVAFYQGTTLIGNVTTSPYNYTWANVSAGTYAVTALAADSHGLMATSSVVSIVVTNGYGLPVVTITSPVNNAAYAPNSNISIAANAGEGGGTITNVEFYANGTDLGGSTSSPYGITWDNVSIGNYALTAVAADASGNMATSSIVNISVAAQHFPPTVSLTSPTNNAFLDVAPGLTLSAAASTSNGTITNVAFYLNAYYLVANVASAPYTFNWSNAPSGDYTLTAIATDNTGISSTSAVVSVTTSNSIALATLRQIKTIFVIPLENHDLVQANPEGSPQQLLGNPACPYFNSLITPGNSNSVQTACATHYFSCAIGGEHPSEPNYLWSEAGTDFGIRTDDDPSTSTGNLFSNVKHFSGQLTTAGIPWHDYQEDVQYSSSEEVSASGSGVAVNPYNGTTEYNYAVKHNPMAFYTDTTNLNCYPMTNLWTDLANNTVAKFNWITPDQYDEMHSSLPNGFTYNGTVYPNSDQSAIAQGDNCLSIIIPKIMASQAYKNNGVIIIWTDETESTDDTNTTLPYVIISPLAKGNAYASTLAYSHSSDLKTMDELFGLAYQTNAIPNGWVDAQNTAYNYVNGSSAIINDLSDFFVAAHVPPVANPVTYTRTANLPLLISVTNLLSNVTDVYGDPITLVGVGTDGMNLLTTNGVTLVNNGSYILYTNSVTTNANDSFEYTVSDGQGGTNVGTVSIIVSSTNNVFGQTSPQLATTGTNVTVTFFGIPNYEYIVDRSTNLMMGAGWVPISTNIAPANGVIQVIDNFQDLGFPVPPLPASVFYRLQYDP